MIASLYQSGLGASASGFSSLRRLIVTIPASYEILEIVLAARVAADPEDVGRHDVRVERDEVPARAPAIARLAEEVVDLEGLVGVDAERVAVDVDEAGVGVAHVEVDDDEDGAVVAALGEAEQLLVVGGMEMQPAHVLQGAVLAADAIDETDERRHRIAAPEVPRAQLVLFVVDVFLDALARDVLHELVGRAVDAVARRQRGG